MKYRVWFDDKEEAEILEGESQEEVVDIAVTNYIGFDDYTLDEIQGIAESVNIEKV